jgi:hypothetical protein
LTANYYKNKIENISWYLASHLKIPVNKYENLSNSFLKIPHNFRISHRTFDNCNISESTRISWCVTKTIISQKKKIFPFQSNQTLKLHKSWLACEWMEDSIKKKWEKSHNLLLNCITWKLYLNFFERNSNLFCRFIELLSKSLSWEFYWQ